MLQMIQGVPTLRTHEQHDVILGHTNDMAWALRTENSKRTSRFDLIFRKK